VSNVGLHIKSDEIISQLFPAAVRGLILPIDNYLSQLNSDEFEIVRKASDKRKYEFSTGRWCAKQLLPQHVQNKTSILSGEHHEPVWPKTIVGSISHCKKLCGAVIADDREIKSIGFDVETRKELKNNIARVVCTEPEKKWLKTQTSFPYDILVLLLFSLKESVYKCVYQNQKIKLSFKDCIIYPEFENNTAKIQFTGKDVKRNIELRFKLTDGYIFSGAVYPAPKIHIVK